MSAPATRAHLHAASHIVTLKVPLVWGGFCQGSAARVLSISRPRVSLFDLAGSFVPTRTSASRARTEAVKDGCVSAHRRLVLEGFEHDGTLERVGDDDVRGELRVGARSIVATSLYAAGQRPKP